MPRNEPLHVRLERFLPDIMHAGLLGTAKVHNGAILTYLVEQGVWGPLPRGVYEELMHERLRIAYASFKGWCKQHRLRVVQPRFTPARLHRKARNQFPALSAKAIAGKAVSFWLCSVASQWASRPGSSATDKLVWVCAWAYCSMMRQLGHLPLVLSEDEARSVYNDGMLHLQAYAQLRSLSASTRRGNMKNTFLLLPKHHHIQEMLRSMLAERVNPYWHNLLTAEAFVGQVGKITRRLGNHSVYVLQLSNMYLHVLYKKLFTGETFSIRPAHRSSVSFRGLQRYLAVMYLKVCDLERLF